MLAFKRMGVVKCRSPFGTVDILRGRRDDKRDGRQDNSALGSLSLAHSVVDHPFLFLPSIMNQQQPAANSQPGASLYMGQRLEMEYLCAGARRPLISLAYISHPLQHRLRRKKRD